MSRFAGLLCFVTQVIVTDSLLGQVLTHGPVVGGVTADSAKVFLRTDKGASVVLRYGIDPTLTDYRSSETYFTHLSGDFTAIVSLPELATETTYYLNPEINGVPQLEAPYPSFATFPRS